MLYHITLPPVYQYIVTLRDILIKTSMSLLLFEIHSRHPLTQAWLTLVQYKQLLSSYLKVTWRKIFYARHSIVQEMPVFSYFPFHIWQDKLKQRKIFMLYCFFMDHGHCLADRQPINEHSQSWTIDSTFFVHVK